MKEKVIVAKHEDVYFKEDLSEIQYIIDEAMLVLYENMRVPVLNILTGKTLQIDEANKLGVTKDYIYYNVSVFKQEFKYLYELCTVKDN